MLHACLCTICFVFCYTSWRFYAFSGTNLLTRRHSASSLFSAIFVFHKSYTRNILGIGQNKTKNPKLLFFRTKDEERKRAREGPGISHTLGRRRWPLGCATLWCGPPGCPLTLPLRLYKASRRKSLNRSAIFQKKSRSSAAATDEFRGTEVSVPAPCQDEEVPPEPYPSMPSPPSPSPSTSPPSSSTLMSPMMRRE
jgi:hypothetical protein